MSNDEHLTAVQQDALYGPRNEQELLVVADLLRASHRAAISEGD